MGCPGMYYKKALQNFAYSLYRFSNKEKAQQLLNEDSVEKIEKEITARKENISVEEFMFEAGFVAGTVLECADRDDGCDGFNACLGGLNEFEEFVKGYESRISLEDIIMRAEDTLQFMMDFRGDMYYSRQECLNQLFCVIGNGYEWIDGELVESSIETSELLSRWQLSNPIEHAKPTKSREECGRIREEIWNRRGIKTDRWYPLSKKYSYLFNYPKDIKPDWMALVEECRQMLIDNGIDLENVPD